MHDAVYKADNVTAYIYNHAHRYLQSWLYTGTNQDNIMHITTVYKACCTQKDIMMIMHIAVYKACNVQEDDIKVIMHITVKTSWLYKGRHQDS